MKWPLAPILLLLCSVAASGCSQATPGGSDRQDPPQPSPKPPSGRAPQPDAPLIVFFGDSLTAGHGLEPEQAYPAVLERALEKEGLAARIVNAGVSGDTTAGGLRRLDWVLSQSPDILVVELGANDGLRGQPLEETEQNLTRIVEQAQRAGSRVLLVGMRIPPSYGLRYAGRFADIYPRVARRLKIPLVPFLLEGVAGRAELNQEDGLHPNAEGQRRAAQNVLPAVRELLRSSR